MDYISENALILMWGRALLRAGLIEIWIRRYYEIGVYGYGFNGMIEVRLLWLYDFEVIIWIMFLRMC